MVTVIYDFLHQTLENTPGFTEHDLLSWPPELIENFPATGAVSAGVYFLRLPIFDSSV